MFARILPFALAFGFAACGLGKNDADSLTAKATAPVLGSSCSACHGYPLKDTNHDYHLFQAGRDDDLNGAITCLDCHSQSVKSKAVIALDSVFEDSTGGKWHAISHPGDTARNSDGIIIRNLPLSRVDSLPQNHPVAMPARPGPVPDFQEYVTSVAHMNGKVDVAFNPRNSNPGEFNGDSASYNPKMETCSAVACHPGPGTVYRFRSLSKGLKQMDSDGEGD